MRVCVVILAVTLAAVGVAQAQVTKAVAVLHPASGSDVRGTVTFTKVDGGVKIVAEATGLKPGEHGFHIHEFGDCSAPDGTSTGGHFNPRHMQHGAPDAAARHAGDFGNIKADASGKAHYERTDKMISLEGADSIIGRGLIVHEKADDLLTQPRPIANPTNIAHENKTDRSDFFFMPEDTSA